MSGVAEIPSSPPFDSPFLEWEPTEPGGGHSNPKIVEPEDEPEPEYRVIHIHARNEHIAFQNLQESFSDRPEFFESLSFQMSQQIRIPPANGVGHYKKPRKRSKK